MINKRVFGSPIPINVQKKLEARQLVAEGGKTPDDSIQTRYPDEHDRSNDGSFYYYDELIANNFEMQGDLSSRTPFARMWTGIALVNERDFQINSSTEEPNESTEDTIESSKQKENELDKINSALQKIKYKELERTVYMVGTHNLSTLDNYDNRALNPNSEIHQQVFPPEHGVEGDDNKFMKPAAGITSITSNTEGILGSIKKTEVSFTIHNFADYDKIYSKFFLRPGAQIFVDFGWDTLKDKSGEDVYLYDPREILNLTSTGNQLSNDEKIEHKLYGVAGETKDVEEDGFVTRCNGDVETVVGIVTNYTSKIMENGSVECTVTLTSKNSALINYPKHIGENTQNSNMKFEFDLDNLIFYEQAYNLGSEKDKEKLQTAVEKLANSTNTVEDELGFETFLNSVKWRSFGSKSFVPTVMAGISGLFVVGDEEVDDTYIQWGLLEDKIFAKYFGHGDDLTTLTDDNEGKFTVRLDSSDGFTAFEDGFLLKQANTSDAPPFLIPYCWDVTFNRPQDTTYKEKAGMSDAARITEFAKTQKAGYSDYGDRAGFVKKMKEVKKEITDFITTNYEGNNSNTAFSPEGLPGQRPIRIFMNDDATLITKYDKEVKRIPIREVFVNMQIVKDAFKNENNTTFRDIITEILDAINGDSYGLWDWKLCGEENIMKINDMNYSHTAIGTKDERQSEFDKMFKFHIMSKDSIVTNYDVSFDMPSGDIGSMYAIQAMTGTPAKMNPISTIIESHSALQTILNKYNTDLKKVGFRYLPDMGAYNAFNMASQQFNQEQKLKYYTDISNEVGGKVKRKGNASYGVGVGVASPSVVWADSEQDKAKKTDLFGDEKPSHDVERRVEVINRRQQEQGKNVVGSVEDYYEYKITGEFITEDHYKAIPLPMKLELTIYGIATLKPGDTFRVDYLPELYMEYVYFQVLNVSHNITSGGWYTTLETQFRISPHRYEDSNMLKAPASADNEEQENLKKILQENNVDVSTSELILNKVALKENQQKAEPAPVVLNATELKGGGLLKFDIDDSRAYMWDSDATSFSTLWDRRNNSYWQRPTSGKFQPYSSGDDDWDYVVADNTKGTPKVKGVKVSIINNSVVDTGQASGTVDVITNGNFNSLKAYMSDLVQEDEKKYNYFEKLFTFKIDAECPVYIANPLYYWSSGYNRYNGYGHWRCTGGHGFEGTNQTYRGGIFWPGEKVYLFINSEDPKRWWGVHPYSSAWPVSNYDTAAFDPRWDADEWSDEGWEGANAPDKF